MIKKSLFRPFDEQLNLWMPVVFLVMIGFEIALRQRFVDSTLLNEIFVELVFLNLVHNSFTYLMLLNLPEFLPWVEQMGSHGVRKFWIKIALLNAAIAAGFLTLFSFIDIYQVQVVFLLIFFLIPIHHALSQSFGLSLVYSKQIDRNKSKPSLEKWERYFFRFFIGIILVGAALLTFSSVQMFSFQDPVMEKIWLLVQYLTYTASVVMVLISLFLIKHAGINRFIFSLRYLVWGLTTISPFAIVATKVIHGVEYAFVTRKMISSSKRRSWKSWALVIVLVTVVVGYFRLVFLQQDMNSAGTPIWLKIISSVSLAIAYSHYYLDRKLFQFRYELNRQTTGRLLMNSDHS